MSQADLNGAGLREADLREVDLSGSKLYEVVLDYTTFGNVNLSQTYGLETIRHSARSTIGIDTIYRSRAEVPESFLRGAGVSDSFIEYMRSLVGKPIDYYSCFIRYSSQDDDFACRLHADLQAKNVRCWFAPEDLP